MRKEMKLVFRYPRALNSGWLPTNARAVNHGFNCRSDLGTIDVHSGAEFPASHFKLMHGQSLSYSITPFVVASDDSIRKIPSKLWVASILLFVENCFICKNTDIDAIVTLKMSEICCTLPNTRHLTAFTSANHCSPRNRVFAYHSTTQASSQIVH